MSRGFRIGLAAIVMLVVLRVTIGWHFLYEGMWKQAHPGFSAEGFFRQSRGPLAQRFKEVILPDEGGLQRLKLNTYKEAWDGHLRAVVAHYGFNADQQAAAGAIRVRYEDRLAAWFEQNKEQIEKYVANWKKLVEDRQQPAAMEVPFVGERLAKRETELRGKAGPWLDYLAAQDAAFERELDKLVGDDQRERGPLPCQTTTLERIDAWTGPFLIVVGACLIVGLLTRLNCVAGAAFLALVVASHLSYPGVWPQPHPAEGHALLVNKDFVEAIALLALAATPVGRWGGLDFVIHHGLVRRRFARRKADAPDA